MIVSLQKPELLKPIRLIADFFILATYTIRCPYFKSP
jgi:hypothetical protein